MADPGVRNLVIEAIAGEKRSFALYRRAADLCQSGSVATLLRRLAADEWRHILLLIEYFDARLPDLAAQVTFGLPPVDDPLADHLAKLGLPGVLRYARDKEAASVRGLERRLAQTESVESRAVLRKLLDDERRHLKSMDHEVERLRSMKTDDASALGYETRRVH